MNGIEKLTQQINAQAQAEIDAVMTQAQAEADAITAGYARRAQAATDEIRAKGEANAAQREERLLSMAAMEGRKQLLAAKQEMLAQAFDLALDKLCALPDEEYVAVLTRLVVSAASGSEQLIFSQRDRTRVGKAVVTAANEALDGGHLTLSEQTRPIRGGVILSSGRIEVNCSFEALIRMKRGEIAGEAASVLFA